jgi:hypothetical protein
MSEPRIPNFGQLLAPFIEHVSAEARPVFLAMLERGAAQRYRFWAEERPDLAHELLACALTENEIADRVEALFPIEPSMREQLTEGLDGARRAYYEVFIGLSHGDQLRIQAGAERQGAMAWSSMAARSSDARVIAELRACADLESANATRLDALVIAHSL